VPRAIAAQRTKEERSYLARLVESMLADDAPDARSAEYMSLLDRALEDRRVSAAEAEALVRAAGELGLSRAEVQVAHRTYLAGLVAEAMSDSVITPTERADLELVTELLGLNTAALEALLAGPPATVVPRSPGAGASELVGKSVCFTGEITALYQGERITRTMAEGLAIQAGLEVLPRVTKKLDILVVADPDTMSLKAQAALRNGTRIMAQAAFWKAIGVAVA
jgi:DNA polymerase-3 subunit epsilon